MIRFRIAARVGRVRCVATRIPEEWPSSAGNRMDRTRLTGHLTHFCSIAVPSCFDKLSMRKWINDLILSLPKDELLRPEQ